MENLVRWTKGLLFLFEFCYWIFVSMGIFLALFSLWDPSWIDSTFRPLLSSPQTNGLRFSIVTQKDGVLILPWTVFFLMVAVQSGLYAMVFRNIRLILARVIGSTPFQTDISRMIKEIGLFLIGLGLLNDFGSIFLWIFGGPLILSFDLKLILIGLVCLCLSRYFQNGKRLQDDMDGSI